MKGIIIVRIAKNLKLSFFFLFHGFLRLYNDIYIYKIKERLYNDSLFERRGLNIIKEFFHCIHVYLNITKY